MYVTRWGVYPVYPSWTWPGHGGQAARCRDLLQGDAVRLYLDDKLIGEKPTTRAERFTADFASPMLRES